MWRADHERNSSALPPAPRPSSDTAQDMAGSPDGPGGLTMKTEEEIKSYRDAVEGLVDSADYSALASYIRGMCQALNWVMGDWP